MSTFGSLIPLLYYSIKSQDYWSQVKIKTLNVDFSDGGNELRQNGFLNQFDNKS